MTTRPTALTSRSYGAARRANSANRCCPRTARRARFHLGGKLSAGGRRQTEGQARSVREERRFAPAFFAVRGSGRVNGLRTARKAGAKFAVRISHPDLCVLRTGRVVGNHMARFHRPLTCTAHNSAAAGLPGEHASSALASPSKRARREIARAAAAAFMPNFPFRVMCSIRHQVQNISLYLPPLLLLRRRLSPWYD